MSIICILERKIRELTSKRLPDSNAHYFLRKAARLKGANKQPRLEGKYFICILKMKQDSFNIETNRAMNKRAAEAYSRVDSCCQHQRNFCCTVSYPES
jgi:hypothetical protein